MKPRYAAIALLAVLAAGPARAEGDATRGQELFEATCTGCHSLDQSRIGPMLGTVYGRTAGMVEGFNYTPAVRDSGVVWTEETLEPWLTNPRDFIAGTRMPLRVSDAQKRADIIAFLKSLSGQ